MTIYILILGILFISILKNIDRNKKRQKRFIILIFSMLTIIAMIRSWSVGIDTLQYYRNFTIISQLNWNQVDLLRYEPGFFYLCKSLSYISKDPHILIMVSSMLIIPSVGRFIYKYSSHMALSTFLYITLNIYFFHLTGMRQSLAISIFLYGFDYLITKQYIKYLIVILIATSFHSSAILLVVLILFQKINYNKTTYIKMIGITVFCFLFYKYLFKYVSMVFVKYSGYVDSNFGESNYFGALFMFLLGFFLYSISHYWQFKNNRRIQMKSNVIGKMSLRNVSIAVCFQAMTIQMNIIGRMTPYFWIFIIISLPDSLYQINDIKNRKLWIMLITLIVFLYWLIIGIFRPEWNGAIPYSTYLSE